MLVLIWEFHAQVGSEEAFEEHYGPDGTWAKFFREDASYRGTRLLRDTAEPSRYLTLDYWESKESYERFRVSRRVQYEQIDRECQRLSRTEAYLGSLDVPGGSPTL